MPANRGNGAHCAIFGCGTCRKHGLSLFRLPTAKDERTTKWRSDMVNVITKDRVNDAIFKRKLENNTVYICEKHFNEEDMYHYPSRKELRSEAYPLPSQNLPIKSVPRRDIQPRSTASIDKRSVQLSSSASNKNEESDCYKSYDDFVRRTGKLKLPSGWKVNHNEHYTEVVKEDENFDVNVFQIFVNTTLEINLRCFGWLLPKDSPLLVEVNSFKEIHLTNFIKILESRTLCDGINMAEFRKAHHISHHVVAKKFKFDKEKTDHQPLYQNEFLRSPKCSILLKAKETCHECKKLESKVRSEIGQKRKHLETPASKFAPLSLTSPERVVLAVKAARQENKDLRAENERLSNLLKTALEKKSVHVQEELSEDLIDIFQGVPEENLTPFLRLFWTEQMKYIRCKNKKQLRYHPSIIKFCLNICAKSSAAYEQLRLDLKDGTGVLVLPSKRTLRQYRNYVRPQHGFNPQITKDLSDYALKLSDHEKFVSIVIDEMKIQEDLVWDKNTGELIGFIDLGDESINEGTIKDREKLASHVMVFIVKSITHEMSYSFANFATDGASAAQIHLLFWKCVSILELTCGLKVIATVSDGASTNRRFIKMNKDVEDEKCNDVVYRTKNLYASDDRYIYFFADPPHLIKTARNALWKSGNDISGRYMWNNGFYLFWKQIKDLFFEDLELGLKSVPHLTTDHIMLNSYSVMNVKLAANVLSEATSVGLSRYGPPSAKETAYFCSQFDKFFDCFNVRDLQSSKKKIKPFLEKYEKEDDGRFAWLDSFIEYLDKWKQSIATRKGEFTQTQRNNMFLSLPTYEGIKISIRSLQEVVPYLLKNGCKFVLSSNFSQDDIENYFGRQRAIGSRKSNPNARDTLRNDRIIKSQYDPKPIPGGNSSEAI